MTLGFDKAVEEERRKNVLRGLPADGFIPSNKPVSTIRQPARLPEIKSYTTLGEQRDGIQSAGINLESNKQVPKINETTNAQRDAELGKMTVAKNGNTTTYDIGGNTLSFEGDKDKISLRNLNQSGNQQSTWNDYRRQLKDRYDAYANSPRGRFFGATPLDIENPVDDSIGEMFVRGLQSRQARADALITNAEADRDMNRANFLSTLDRNQIARDQLSLDADRNRIDEQGVIAENKLRDIQGQVLQNPPIKENELKPLVVKEYDDLGNVIGERIKLPGPDGTYGESNQSKFTESQSDIIKRLVQMRESKDPRLVAAEAKYKAHFGSLPY